MTTLYDIDKFCDYFASQVAEIDKLNPEPVSEEAITQVILYKKTLIVSAIDALACLRFSKENYKQLNKFNQARFIRFIAEHAQWEEGNLVSLPCLYERLTRLKADHSKLYEFVRDRLTGLDGNAGQILNVQLIDMEAELLLDFSRSENEENLIHKSQHYALLYGYKDCIAQPTNELSGVMETCQYAQPHYFSYIKNRSAEEVVQWHLAYPVEHFKYLFFNSIRNIRLYFIKTRINPYSLSDVRSGHSRWW